MRLLLPSADENPVEFDGNLDLSTLPGVLESVSLDGPVHVVGRLGRDDRGDLHLTGSFTSRGETGCSRCLRPIALSPSGAFDLVLVPRSEEPTAEDHSLSAKELDMVYHDGEGVDVDPLVAEQVVLAVPMKPLCQEDCRGLCPTCGANRNEAACDCAPDTADPRWGALAALAAKDDAPPR